MVLEVKGKATALLSGRVKPLRTLQTLSSGTEIEVAQGGVLRLAYLENGRREKITGPCSLTIGSTGSQDAKGKGNLEVEAERGTTTLLPRSENLRRMGGTIHAKAQLEAMDLIASLPVEKTHQVRIDPKPRIQDLPPSLSVIPPGREVYWIGGEPPYTVSIRREEGAVELRQEQTSSALALPPLEPGHVFVLEVVDGKGITADPKTFYLLSQEERQAVASDLERIAKQGSRHEQLALSIAYLEARGLLTEALAFAEQAVAREPNDVGLLTTLGRLQLQLGRQQEAESTLNRAMELDSKESR